MTNTLQKQKIPQHELPRNLLYPKLVLNKAAAFALLLIIYLVLLGSDLVKD